jgi:hypothetical protein
MQGLFFVLALAALFQEPAAPPTPNDYADGKNWLCRPGREDACAVDLATTVVAADGKLTREEWTADPKAPIDCFYVYPTVSTDPTPNSDMTPDPAETNVVRQQFARFASVCRPYAPLYRQVTLAGLRRMLAGGGGGGSLASGVGYDDVRDAWNHYLKNDNQGRGVVLIGHSQGSYVLAELVRKEIDGKPVQSRLVSALLLGATMSVPKGKDLGGSFQNIPVCRKPGQTGCLVAFSSFRSTVPPPADSRFGKVDDPERIGVCVNPCGARRRQRTASRVPVGRRPHHHRQHAAETVGRTGADHRDAVRQRPGLITAECKTNEYATFLEVTLHGDPADPRVDDITGDIGVAGKPVASWGLHLIDVNLAMGDLLDVVRQQSKAYAAKKK